MNLTRENILDLWSGFSAIIGVVITLVASELALPSLMIVGVGVVAITAILRVSNFRGKLHGRK